MGSFEKAFAYAMVNETSGSPSGGYTNDPKDPGKATKWGITQASYSDYLGRAVTVDDIKSITQDEAKLFYRATRWKWVCGDVISNDGIATAIFDAAVLFGVTGSVVEAQRACQAEGFPISADGHMGMRTVETLSQIKPQLFCHRFEEYLHDRINRIIDERPASDRYRYGWIDRIERYVRLFDLALT